MADKWASTQVSQSIRVATPRSRGSERFDKSSCIICSVREEHSDVMPPKNRASFMVGQWNRLSSALRYIQYLTTLSSSKYYGSTYSYLGKVK